MLCGIYKPANWYAIVYLWAVYQFSSALFQCSIFVFVLSIWKFFANPKLYTPNYHSIVWCVTKRIWREIKLHIWMRKHIIEMPLHTHYSPSAAHNNRHFLRTASLSLSLFGLSSVLPLFPLCMLCSSTRWFQIITFYTFTAHQMETYFILFYTLRVTLTQSKYDNTAPEYGIERLCRQMITHNNWYYTWTLFVVVILSFHLCSVCHSRFCCLIVNCHWNKVPSRTNNWVNHSILGINLSDRIMFMIERFMKHH